MDKNIPLNDIIDSFWVAARIVVDLKLEKINMSFDRRELTSILYYLTKDERRSIEKQLDKIEEDLNDDTNLYRMYEAIEIIKKLLKEGED